MLPSLALSRYMGWGECPDGSQSPCNFHNQQCGDDFTSGPQFHFRDRSCGLNDPNGNFYDPVHGLYHLFYQDHIGRPIPKTFPQGFEGPSWGHAVSPDMVHWTHLPVALWNGETWYDVHALFTGSATLVDGKPKLVFPGVCDLYPPSGDVQGCKYGYTFGVASPSNSSDPFYTNWTKSSLNPIVLDTFDDPSTAWQTATGKWRWIANCGDGKVGDCGNGSYFQAPLYEADATFTSAHKVGLSNLEAGECPSMYPLPPLSPNTAPVPGMPSHVHKWGCQPYKDCVEIGTWHEGNHAHWERLGGTAPIVIDQGSAYACKDLFDAKGRRINTAWARLQPDKQGSRVNGDVHTVAREVTYHPLLRQLLFYPLEEQAALRRGVLSSVSEEKTVSVNHPVILGPWEEGNQSDVLIHARIPDDDVTLYISIRATVRVQFYIDFKKFSPSNSSEKFHKVEVGMLTDDPFPSIKDTLRLFGEEEELELRLLLDHTIIEAYWMAGRVAMTVSAPLTDATSISLSTDTSPTATVRVTNTTVWKMGSAWISNQDALDYRAR